MEFNDVVEKRRSIRAFKSKHVSFKDILDAIDTATQGPFAGNMNHMKFLIVEEQDMIKKIAKATEQVWIEQAQTIVIPCSDDRHLETMYSERGRVYSRQQAGAAIENFLLRITELGLSSCWVGAFTDEVIKQLLGIPAHIQVEAILPVGYANEKGEKKKKRNLDTVIFWEKWNEDRRQNLFKEPPMYNYG